MKAKITRPDGTILELEDVTVLDLCTLGYGTPLYSVPVTTIPSVDTCIHEYPTPWLGIVPPSCKKCGAQAPDMGPSYGVTFLTAQQ